MGISLQLEDVQQIFRQNMILELRFFKYEFVCKICQQFHGTHTKVLEGNTSANVLSHFILKAPASELQNSNVQNILVWD